MTKPHDWALIADAQHARVLERTAPAGPWHELESEAEERFAPPSRAQGSDRPGRVVESVGGARHAVEPRHDPHREAKRAFAEELAGRLEAALRAGRCQRLILVAPPAFLGDLRAALSPAAKRALLGTLDKDLTRHPLAEILPHLEEIRPPE